LTLTDWLLASVLSTSSVDCPWLMCRRKGVVLLLIFLDGVYSLEVLSDVLMRIYLLIIDVLSGNPTPPYAFSYKSFLWTQAKTGKETA
jgi:hypothetical protein